MKTSLLIVMAGLALAVSCTQPIEQKTFSLTVLLNPDAKPGMLYLEDARSGIPVPLDSGQVKDGKVAFNAALPESPMQAVLRNKDYSQFTVLWLEDNAMQLDATQTTLAEAKVTGSETDSLSKDFQARLLSLPQDSSYEERSNAISVKFIKDHPNSIMGVSMLANMASVWGRSTTESLYNRFTPEIQQSTYGAQIAHYLSLNKDPQLGDAYIDFSMANSEGVETKLSENTAKATLLEFWASWCGSCRKKNPDLVKTYQRYHEAGLEIFAVSLDSEKASWLAAIEADSLTWLHVSDLKGAQNTAALTYGTRGASDNFLIDSTGKIVGRNLWGKELNEAVEGLLKPKVQ